MIDTSNCLRCNRDKIEMSMDLELRTKIYFLSESEEDDTYGDSQTYDIILQQMVDSIYCFIFHCRYFV